MVTGWSCLDAGATETGGIKSDGGLSDAIPVKWRMLNVHGLTMSMSVSDVQRRGPRSKSSVASASLSGPADSLPAAATELGEVEYPYEDDIAMACGPAHEAVTVDTRDALVNYCASRPNAYRGMDMLVYYERYDITKRVTPDLFVVFDARLPIGRNYRIWDAGKPPDVVWELAPDSHMKGDPKEKKELYRQLGVPEYWLYDCHGALDGPRLQGFQLVKGRYRRLPASPRGDGVLAVKSPLLGLEQHYDGQRLRLWDPANKEYLRTSAESERERVRERKGWQREREGRLKAEARAAAADDRAVAAEAREAALMARIAELEASGAIHRK